MASEVTEKTPWLSDSPSPFPIKDLQPYYMNAKEHDIDSIMESLSTLGQFAPIIVNVGSQTGRKNEILDGNGTWEAAERLGWKVIDCDFVDVDDTVARKINLAANSIQERAGFDKDILIESLGLLDDLVATGYTIDDVNKMLTPFDPTDDLDEGEQMGDLEFRVVVDCRDEDHQRVLMEKFEAEGLSCRPLIAPGMAK